MLLNYTFFFQESYTRFYYYFRILNMVTAFLRCSLGLPHRMGSVLQSVDQSAVPASYLLTHLNVKLLEKLKQKKMHIVLCNEMLHI